MSVSGVVCVLVGMCEWCVYVGGKVCECYVCVLVGKFVSGVCVSVGTFVSGVCVCVGEYVCEWCVCW